jgi:putative flippase GtrA
MNARPERLLRYAAVGIATFAIYLGAGQLLNQSGLAPAWQASLAFAAAVAVNYLLQRSWVFEDGRPMSTTLPRYLTMIGIGFAVNTAAFVMLSPVVALVWAQTAAAGLVVLSNAVFSFAWVFGRRHTACR